MSKFKYLGTLGLIATLLPQWNEAEAMLRLEYGKDDGVVGSTEPQTQVVKVDHNSLLAGFVPLPDVAATEGFSGSGAAIATYQKLLADTPGVKEEMEYLKQNLLSANIMNAENCITESMLRLAGFVTMTVQSLNQMTKELIVAYASLIGALKKKEDGNEEASAAAKTLLSMNDRYKTLPPSYQKGMSEYILSMIGIMFQARDPGKAMSLIRAAFLYSRDIAKNEITAAKLIANVSESGVEPTEAVALIKLDEDWLVEPAYDEKKVVIKAPFELKKRTQEQDYQESKELLQLFMKNQESIVVKETRNESVVKDGNERLLLDAGFTRGSSLWNKAIFGLARLGKGDSGRMALSMYGSGLIKAIYGYELDRWEIYIKPLVEKGKINDAINMIGSGPLLDVVTHCQSVVGSISTLLGTSFSTKGSALYVTPGTVDKLFAALRYCMNTEATDEKVAGMLQPIQQTLVGLAKLPSGLANIAFDELLFRARAGANMLATQGKGFDSTVTSILQRLGESGKEKPFEVSQLINFMQTHGTGFGLNALPSNELKLLESGDGLFVKSLPSVGLKRKKPIK
ncbi:MAG: hypothetical protein LBT63_00825 [Holosporaceae bacterium]|jgi:hypothetical protein|nr:hypothetical protein [Holosporaceae bacterium]